MADNSISNGKVHQIYRHINGKEYTYWQANYTCIDTVTGQKTRKTITAKSEAEVLKKLNDSTQQTIHSPCLNEWLSEWQDTFLLGVKPSTKYIYESSIRLYISPIIGNVLLEELNPIVIQRMYSQLIYPKNNVKPISTKLLKCVHGILHEALDKAVALGYMKSNPTNVCELPRVIKKEIEPLNDEHIAMFIKKIQGHKHEILYTVALFSGMREAEVLGLTWDCVDFNNEVITVKKQLCRERQKGGKYYFSSTKNGKTRRIPIAPYVVEALKKQRHEQFLKRTLVGAAWEEHNLVFSNDVGGFLSYRTVYDCYKRIVKSIGIPNARFHDLRHTFAVISLQNGDDIKTVQKNLGHSTAAFTLDVYGHVSEKMDKESAKRMQNYISNLF